MSLFKYQLVISILMSVSFASASLPIEPMIADIPSAIEKPSLWETFLLGFGKTKVHTCEEKTETLKTMGESELYNEGMRKLKAAISEKAKWKTFCRLSNYFLAHKQTYPESMRAQEVKVRLAEAFYYGTDFNGAINEMDELLNEIMVKVEESETDAEETVATPPVQKPLAAYAHYILLRSVFAQVLSPGLNQEWARYSLGIHLNQGKTTAYLESYQRLSMHFHKASFKTSPYQGQVDSMVNQSRETFVGNNFKVSKFYLKKKAYKAAIQGFSLIAKHGANTTHFSASLFYLSQSFHKFHLAVEKGKVSDAELAVALELPMDKEVPREQMSQKLLLNGQQVYQKMLKNLPDDQWTQKAKKYWSKYED